MDRASMVTERAEEWETWIVWGSLGTLEPLKKAMEDPSGLRDIVFERQSVIDSLQLQETQNIKEKLKLRVKA